MCMYIYYMYISLSIHIYIYIYIYISNTLYIYIYIYISKAYHERMAAIPFVVPLPVVPCVNHKAEAPISAFAAGVDKYETRPVAADSSASGGQVSPHPRCGCYCSSSYYYYYYYYTCYTILYVIILCYIILYCRL